MRNGITSNSARVRDNVVFLREPGKPFNPFCVKFGLSGDSCIYMGRVVSIINQLGMLLKYPG